MEKMNLSTVAWARPGIRLVGWRWKVLDGILQYRKEWRDEERQAGMTAL
jgi:hypothetical protein